MNENYGTTIEDLNFTTDHSVTINDLAAETLYHYRIISIDGGGNVTVSTDLTYTTLRVKSLTLGDYHTCALTSAGGVKCWGHGYYGELGDGTATHRFTPVDVVGLSTGVTAIEAGGHHTCALMTSGGVKCWGDNGGWLGDGTTIGRPTPVDVVGLSTGVKAIEAGREHTCALMTSGEVKCWGYNSAGQLGQYPVYIYPTPVKPLLGDTLPTDVTAITAGGFHTCSLTSSGGVKCWGYNNYGQIGGGYTNLIAIQAIDVVGLSTGVTAIDAGERHTCALTTSGGVKCWGDNNYGQIGDGTLITRYAPVDVSSLSSDIIAIATGGFHTCALTASGGVKCWGYNNYDLTPGFSAIPLDVVGLSTGVTAIEAGGHHTCARTTSGGVKCWGDNGQGQLGDGTNGIDNSHLTPVDVSGLH